MSFASTYYSGGFSSNSSRTILKSKAYGKELVLSDKLTVPKIYLKKVSTSTTYDVGMTCTKATEDGGGTFTLDSASNEFTGTTLFDAAVEVDATLKAKHVFANYLALSQKGSIPSSEFAALENETGNWGGT